MDITDCILREFTPKLKTKICVKSEYLLRITEKKNPLPSDSSDSTLDTVQLEIYSGVHESGNEFSSSGYRNKPFKLSDQEQAVSLKKANFSLKFGRVIQSCLNIPLASHGL